MKASPEIIASISAHAEAMRAKYQDAIAEIEHKQTLQTTLDLRHTPTIAERMRFIERMQQLDRDAQYAKGQWDCAAWLLRQNT